MRKGNRRLNYEDRQKIEKMAEQGARVIVIADTIGFHRATIYNELKRGGTPYRADVAQRTVKVWRTQWRRNYRKRLGNWLIW